MVTTTEPNLSQTDPDDKAFNPRNFKVGGLYAVEIVERRRDLTDGQKLLYNRAARWAGHKGRFWHSFNTMAEALGKSVRQIKSDMAALEAAGLVAHVRRGNRQSNVYRFLCSPMFGGEVQPTALREPDSVAQVKCSPASSEVQDSAKVKCSPLHSNQEIESRKNQKTLNRIPDDESQTRFLAPAPGGDVHEQDVLSFHEQTQNLHRNGKSQKRRSTTLRMLATAVLESQPPANFEEKCLLAAHNNATQEQIDQFLREAIRDQGTLRNLTSARAFYALIGRQFNPAEKDRWPEVVAAPGRQSGNGQSTPATVEELMHGVRAFSTLDQDDAVSA